MYVYRLMSKLVETIDMGKDKDPLYISISTEKENGLYENELKAFDAMVSLFGSNFTKIDETPEWKAFSIPFKNGFCNWICTIKQVEVY